MTQPVIEIEDIIHTGEGIAHAGGETIRVPMSAPGDAVAPDEAGEWRVTREGPHRAAPACRHFGACGGCQLQHVEAGSYLAVKRSWVDRALAGQGLEGVEVRGLLACAPGTRRRAAFSAVWDGSQPRVGFHGAKSHKVFGVEECPVLQPDIVAALPLIESLMPFMTRRGGHARVQVSSYEAGLDIAFETEDEGIKGPIAEECLAEARSRRVLRLSLNGEVRARFAPPVVTYGGLSVEPPPGGFLQATQAAETILRSHVEAWLGPCKSVADLYAGIGTFALTLMEGRRLEAYEGEAAAVGALQAAADKAGATKLSAHCRDLTRRPLTRHELSAFDGVVLDPPRVGAEPQAVQLAASPVQRIAYVSCHPASFARDARLLVEGGFVLRYVQPVDQFLWSTHVELVAGFERPKAKSKRPFHPRRKSSIA